MLMLALTLTLTSHLNPTNLTKPNLTVVPRSVPCAGSLAHRIGWFGVSKSNISFNVVQMSE